ncbi:MAG: ribosome silencing factor [Atopobiaceae bacterium]|nr:ribosome silencing factor [Atopobiaceae bacterium]
MAVTPLELAKIAATAADDKKATDILLLDLTDKSDVCDYFLICTVANNPMMDAVVEEVREKVRINCGEKPISVEGRAGSTWVLVDYGAVVLHVFREESREFYRLERLWGDAPHVALDLEGATPQEQWLTEGEVFEDMPEA